MNYGEISTDDEIQAYLDDAYDRWRDDQMEKSQSSKVPEETTLGWLPLRDEPAHVLDLSNPDSGRDSSICPNCNHKEEQSDCECCKNNR